jgi:hypothetical protein
MALLFLDVPAAGFLLGAAAGWTGPSATGWAGPSAAVLLGRGFLTLGVLPALTASEGLDVFSPINWIPLSSDSTTLPDSLLP